MIEGMDTPDLSIGEQVPPSNLAEYFFGLQAEIEQLGGMNYRLYAERMWQRFVPSTTTDSSGFSQFEQQMITGLHGIDMSTLVYPSVAETMPRLVEAYKEKIAGIAIWSTGDVRSTGYQLAKIDRSRVIYNFLDTLRQSMPRGERYEFVRDKTSYLVDDNKFARLVQYVAEQKHDDTSPPPKIVIIDDTVGNFAKAQQALADSEELGDVKIIPIWVTASREGIQAQKHVDDLLSGDPGAYSKAKTALEEQKARLNSIGSFAELLDQNRFGAIFDVAHVMVDFDGVICDNVAMREKQAITIYRALLSGASIATGLTLAELEARFQAVLLQPQE